MNRDIFLVVREVVKQHRLTREELLRDAIDVPWPQRPLKEVKLDCGCEARLEMQTDSWEEWEAWVWTKTCEEHRDPS
jgi:hypothetical protein